MTEERKTEESCLDAKSKEEGVGAAGTKEDRRGRKEGRSESRARRRRKGMTLAETAEEGTKVKMGRHKEGGEGAAEGGGGGRKR